MKENRVQSAADHREQYGRQLKLSSTRRVNIHLIDQGEGSEGSAKKFEWKITLSEYGKDGPIMKWNGVGKPFTLPFNQNQETLEKFDKFVKGLNLTTEGENVITQRVSELSQKADESIKYGSNADRG